MVTSDGARFWHARHLAAVQKVTVAKWHDCQFDVEVLSIQE
jgi:hypothetical protein